MKHNHRFDPTRFRVDPSKKVKLASFDPGYTGAVSSKQEAERALYEDVSSLAASQEVLWASARHAVLVIFQALDAAGKDGAIKHVMSGINPQGVSVHSFKAPSDEERLRPFLWRPQRVLPARGRIAIFNRSYYEEVLAVRVHPEFLEQQFIPRELQADLPRLWESRYAEINAFERHLSRNGICVIKFFLHVSKQEQRKRFLKRLEEKDKHWKFSVRDVQERQHWDEYIQAYEDMLNATSTADAPWYVVPADKKWFTRAVVADLIAARIDELDLKYPQVDARQREEMLQAARSLAEEVD